MRGKITAKFFMMAERDDGDDDPFEAIFLAEERLEIISRAHRLGYEEGQCRGKESGLTDGYRTGYNKGWETGEEIGFYLGIGETMLKLLSEDTANRQDNEKKIKTLSIFLDTLKDFAIMNVHDNEYTEKLQYIRSKYRQIKSLLKLTIEIEQNLNF